MNNQYVFDSQLYHDCREMGEVSQSIHAQYGTGGNNMPFVDDERHDGETVYCLAGNGVDRAETARCNGKGWTEDVSFTLNTIDRPAVATMQGLGDYKMGSVASSLKQRDSKDATDLVCRVEETVMKYDALGVDTQSVTGSTLKARNDGQSNSDLAVNEAKFTVRRLTPLECTRLQGFPDEWTDIPGASDSARYKALGNSIALPFWEFLAHRFSEIGGVKTIGSLFDGISGFPLVFKRAGAETLWTSEIDPFCQKVCQYHLDQGDL